MIRLELPLLPPSTNRIWCRGKHGGVYLHKSVEVFRLEVFAAYRMQRRRTIYGPCRIHATFYPSSKRSIDTDNRIKPLLDALEHAKVVDNDRQFTDQHYTLGAEIRRPRGWCSIEIVEIR